MRDLVFLRAFALLTKVYDLQNYIEEYDVLEKDENQRLLRLIQSWLEAIEHAAASEVLEENFSAVRAPSSAQLYVAADNLDNLNRDFSRVAENMRFVPMQAPYPSLAAMVAEVRERMEPKWRVHDLSFKTIPELNFRESMMRGPVTIARGRRGQTPSPNVLSMTATYLDNPLMWPLIVHEYAHAVSKQPEVRDALRPARDEIYRACPEGVEELTQETTEAMIGEVFADLFALNAQGTNYFYAFLFHEVLGKTPRQLAQNKPDGGGDILPHPPSGVRLEYGFRELKCRRGDRDQVFRWVERGLSPLLDQIRRERLNAPKEPGKGSLPTRNQLTLYDTAYDNMSEVFATDRFPGAPEFQDLNKEVVRMHRRLKERLPVSTRLRPKIALSRQLSNDAAWDVEEANHIESMMATGWRFLLQDMISHLARSRDASRRPFLPDPNTNESTSIEDFGKCMGRFKKEYKLLLMNLETSIETSIVVNNYLRGSA